MSGPGCIPIKNEFERSYAATCSITILVLSLILLGESVLFASQKIQAFCGGRGGEVR